MPRENNLSLGTIIITDMKIGLLVDCDWKGSGDELRKEGVGRRWRLKSSSAEVPELMENQCRDHGSGPLPRPAKSVPLGKGKDMFGNRPREAKESRDTTSFPDEQDQLVHATHVCGQPRSSAVGTHQ